MTGTPEQLFALSRYETGSFPVRLRLEVPASVNAIDSAVDSAMHFAANEGCILESDFEVRLAFHEALANAVLHGCNGDGRKKVHCLIACDISRGLLIVVRDPGNGFDPGAVPCPIDEDRLLQEHGRGIELMRRLVDEVHFERGGTEIHLLKWWPAPTEKQI